MARPRNGIVLATILLYALAGCSSEDGDEPPVSSPPASAASSPSPTPSEAPTPTPSPTPTEIDRDAAAAQYSTLATTVNEGLAVMNTAIAAWDYDGLRASVPTSTAALRTFADGLIAADWPSGAQPSIDRLVTEVSAQISVYARITTDTSDADVDAILTELPSRSAAQEVRIHLGLENVPAS